MVRGGVKAAISKSLDMEERKEGKQLEIAGPTEWVICSSMSGLCFFAFRALLAFLTLYSEGKELWRAGMNSQWGSSEGEVPQGRWDSKGVKNLGSKKEEYTETSGCKY